MVATAVLLRQEGICQCSCGRLDNLDQFGLCEVCLDVLLRDPCAYIDDQGHVVTFYEIDDERWSELLDPVEVWGLDYLLPDAIVNDRQMGYYDDFEDW